MSSLAASESVEALVRIADERQAERRVIAAKGVRLRAELSRVVDLRDFVDWEVLCIDIALELGLERSADLAETIPIDAVEERVVLQLLSSTNTSEAVGRVADETTDCQCMKPVSAF